MPVTSGCLFYLVTTGFYGFAQVRKMPVSESRLQADSPSL
jgi:hypothetical protein